MRDIYSQLQGRVTYKGHVYYGHSVMRDTFIMDTQL